MPARAELVESIKLSFYGSQKFLRSGDSELWRCRADLTLHEYLQIAEAQDYSCAICKCELKFDVTPHRNLLPSVDHDHTSGMIRGILCRRCNVSLGGYENLLSRRDEVEDYRAHGATRVATATGSPIRKIKGVRV